jgi:surface antigen
MTLQQFINEHKGKIVSDPWGTYPGQCVSLVKLWIKENGWPMKAGNAIMWQYNGYGGYKWIPNRPWNSPKPGDIIVFRIGTNGHIGIVVSANVRTVNVLQQNWPRGRGVDPVEIRPFNYTNPKCLGWLRKV